MVNCQDKILLYKPRILKLLLLLIWAISAGKVEAAANTVDEAKVVQANSTNCHGFHVEDPWQNSRAASRSESCECSSGQPSPSTMATKQMSA